ncbi:probable tubulin polyglutamylase ttll-15 [Microplitis mediator]|uniref:probable tubulin polyglutamylase ttll-15 n=1 Tax=Microplitis mediator TaxID=375433 RepID=UPI0025537842|nr:probable tubulin polyglutamylase ttll-15 [Microplitis mediator]
MAKTEVQSTFSNIQSVVLNTKIKVVFKSILYVVLSSMLLSLLLSSSSFFRSASPETEISPSMNNQLTYWIFSKGKDESHLKHIIMILEKLGFRRGNNESNWDLLWAHDYPFRTLANNLKHLQKHQKVNHIPGCGFITNKVELSTTNIEYLPASFRIPQDKEIFHDYIARNPHKSFVEKSNFHRGISIKRVDDINFDDKEVFIQEFIERPYLIDGYKFDIGIYTVITSVDPLRIYVYKGDVLFRFCPHKYYPFDPEDIDKYTIGDDYLPIWNIPSLRKYYVDMGFSMKDSFDAYVKSRDEDPNSVWNKAYEAIQRVVLKKEKQIADSMKQFNNNAEHFFELVRFDFIIDEDLNVFLMEANMSPNLSSAHYAENHLLYEQVLFNLFALVGIGQRIDPSLRRLSSWRDQKIEVADKNLVVFPEICSKCTDCVSIQCKLCKSCFTEELRLILGQSYIEHQNKMDYKRIFPPNTIQTNSLSNYTLKNQLLIEWYRGKCAIDPSWCY